MATFPPARHAEYVELVTQKVHNLIRLGIWDRPTIDDFTKWLRNFPDDAGKYIAAYLADRLIFYSEHDVKALLAYAYDETLRQLALMKWKPELGHPHERLDAEWLRVFEEVRKTALVCPAVTDSPAASGYPMVRYLRDMGKVQESQMCVLQEIESRLRSGRYSALILVDDLLGSGTQVEEFWRGTARRFPTGVSPYARVVEEFRIPCFLAVVAATEPGVSHIRSVIPELNVVAAEVLSTQWDMKENEFWRPGEAEPALDYLRNRVQDAAVRLEGFKGGMWAVSFHHGTPNNCSPVYRYRSDSWYPMIPTREGE